MVNFKENYHFPRFQRGVKHFSRQGVHFFQSVQLLIPYNLGFSRGGGGVGTPCPPSGSAHERLSGMKGCLGTAEMVMTL